MRQPYVVPNLITAFGLFCGLFVIFKVNMVHPGFSTYHMLFSSTLLLLIAALADVLDGAIARIMGGESEFGVMFDSLADAISFGVAPSVLVLKSLSLEQGSTLSFFMIIAVMLYSICGVLRLVRYNVKTSQLKGNELAMQAYKKNFTGLPIPASACCLTSLTLFLNHSWCLEHLKLSEFVQALLLGGSAIFLGCLMISKCKFMSLKALRVKMDSLYVLFLTVVAAIFILYGIIHHFSITFLALFWSYLLIGCLLTLVRLIAGKKSKTLVEFDINHEEDEEL